MKCALNIFALSGRAHSTQLAAHREKLTLTANFLPSAGRELPGRKNFLVAGLNNFLGFAGVFRNHAENLTMAQPLLKGELR
jgi:hypothetical protein